MNAVRPDAQFDLTGHLTWLSPAFDNRVAPRRKLEFPQVTISGVLFAFSTRISAVSTRDGGGCLTAGGNSFSSRHISLYCGIGFSWSANTFLRIW
jgi:hypothetical protein